MKELEGEFKWTYNGDTDIFDLLRIKYWYYCIRIRVIWDGEEGNMNKTFPFKADNLTLSSHLKLYAKKDTQAIIWLYAGRIFLYPDTLLT